MAAKPKKTAAGDADPLLLLPPEIWREILIRLAAKSVLRCRSVCKSWYSLISCPDFISNYKVRNLTKTGSRLLLQLYEAGLDNCSFTTLDKSLMESCEHDYVPGSFLGRHAPYMGSCNGLICLTRCDRCLPDVAAIGFLIWNPSIRKIVELPSRNFCSRTQSPSFVGFGFDSKTNDYKVLCVFMAKSAGLAEESVSEIYDLRKGVWRVISPLVGSSWCVGGHTYNQDFYLNGAVHWSGYRHRDAKSSGGVIFSFDMCDEVFREISMPDIADAVTRSVIFDGLIHVIVWERGQKICSVWAMQEYGVAESWTKVFNIDLPSASARGLPSTSLPSYSLCLWGNGEVLVVCGHPKDRYLGQREILVLYTTGSRKWKRLLSLTKCVSDLCLYEESLDLM